MTRVCLVSFHTEGPPHDDALNLTNAANLLHSQAKNHVDTIYSNTPRTLAEDPWWKSSYKSYKDSRMNLSHNKGAAQCGYFKFKAICLYRAMQKEPDNTILVYLDSNVIKVPYYLDGLDKLRENAEFVLQQCGADIWIGYETPQKILVKHHCKGYTITKLSHPDHIKDIFERSLLVCCRIIVRNTPAMRKMFEDEFLPLFATDEYLAPLPNNHAHPDFKWDTGDQAIWNAVLFSKTYTGHLPRDWPKVYCSESRRFTKSTLKFHVE
jgi:hypothetical protein